MLKFKVWSEERGKFLVQTLNDLLNGIGDDCADCEAQEFRTLVLHDGIEPELITGENNG